ncbi:MAG TPA: hypothetical protein VFC43_07675 [Methanoregula sp.]|nr:hypothetical protein [Methanoregula sp.]
MKTLISGKNNAPACTTSPPLGDKANTAITRVWQQVLHRRRNENARRRG